MGWPGTLVIGAAGAVARLLADVPPRLDGEELFLAVELRWPSRQRPDTLPGQ